MYKQIENTVLMVYKSVLLVKNLKDKSIKIAITTQYINRYTI